MIQKIIKRSIEEYFFVNPSARLRVREIERTLHLPLPSVIRYCKELLQEGILKTVRIGKVMFYTSDRTNEAFLLEKRLFNIRTVHQSGLLEYLKESLNNPAVVLFGSYGDGEDTEDSDIDLYLETPSKKSLDTAKFEKLLHRKIQLFRYENIRKIRNPHLTNNIVNGTPLHKHIEVFS